MSGAHFFALCSLIIYAPHADQDFAVGAAIGYLIAALICAWRGK